MSSISIDYLSRSRVPSRDANSIHAARMCSAFSEMGAEMRLHARPPASDVAHEDVAQFYGIDHPVTVVQHGYPRFEYLAEFVYARRVAATLRRSKPPDVLYGRHAPSLLASRSLSIPTFYEVHAPPTHPVKTMLEQRLFRLDHFAGVVSITRSLASWYQDSFPELRGHPLVVEPDATTLPELAGEEIQSTGGDDRLCVGYVGHLYPGKGMNIVVPLADRLGQFDFHVVGGTDADLARWTSTPNPPNLIFHGFVPPSHVSPLMRTFDVVLAPYQHTVSGSGRGDLAQWMSPLKIFEYLAHARAIVASDLPVLREILDHESTALLCTPDDLDAWAAALSRLAHDPELRRALGLAGRRLVEERYTWSHRAQRLLEFIRAGL